MANNRISHGIDSFMMDLREGYDATPKIFEGVIVSAIWSVDNLLEFYTNVQGREQYMKKMAL